MLGTEKIENGFEQKILKRKKNREIDEILLGVDENQLQFYKKNEGYIREFKLRETSTFKSQI